MILIDDRAGSRDLCDVRQFPRLASLSTLTRLDSADICFSGSGPDNTSVSIGVELKSLSDLLDSAQSGRLQGVDGQLSRMLDEFDECWILTYSVYRTRHYADLDRDILEFERPRRRGVNYMLSEKDTGSDVWSPHTFGNPASKRYIPASYLHKLMFSLSRSRIQYYHTRTKEEATIWLADLYSWWQKPYESHKCMRTLNNSVNSLPAVSLDIDPLVLQRARFAAQFAKIRFERALSIAQHFDSVEDMFNPDIATEKELATIDGIGKTLARSIVTSRTRRSSDVRTNTRKAPE